MTVDLRRAVAGLLSFAAAEEQMLLLSSGEDRGSPDNWAAVPLVAHNNQFKTEQAERLRCVLSGQVPPAYGEIDHSSAAVYQGYLAQPPDAVLAACRQVTAQLVDGTWAVPDEDLLDPARRPWLNGRLLWLQIVVRGFWHPTGHLGDYYLAHGQPERAVALQEQGLAMARYLGAPAPAAGMAGYSLACAQARAGDTDQAARTLAEAIQANPDLRANASRDPDLRVVREACPAVASRG
jgi:tetratricopeptide (TPR) repeat protein